MASLRTSMDASFYDLNIATPLTLHGAARSIPGEPTPVDGACASKLVRMQQLSYLGLGFPLGFIPSYAPPLSSDSKKGAGSLSFESLWLTQPAKNWLLGFIGQIRPMKLLSSVKNESSSYSVGLCSQLDLSESTSIVVNVEKDGQGKNRRTRGLLYHKLPNHDITVEAAWPELFVDRKSRYWEMQQSLSLDCSSLVSENGLRYHVCIRKNGGLDKGPDLVDGQPPASLSEGVCAKAAFSYEKSKDLWRKPEIKEDIDLVKRKGGKFHNTAYDIRMKEPHATVSGIVGGSCEAWFSGRRSPFGADIFGSICFAVQHGKFTEPFGDLTRFDARLDISSASALISRFSNTLKSSSASPRLNLILQKQIAGPLTFRVNSKVAFDSPSPHIEDIIFSLNYSLRQLGSGKVVAWYSPMRNEAMLEMRILEF